MKFVIVTGMSGAGKTTALKFLEDIGFFCVDNLPPSLIPKLAEVCFRAGSEIKQVALGIDIRGGKLFDDFFTELATISIDYNFEILFLDSTDEVLLKRYKETRKAHPLAKNDRVITGIEKERELLVEVKQRADFIIDTSMILTRQLKEQLIDIFIDHKAFDSLVITIMSFGFKFGIPTDSDLVFDVRFLPNPFYIAELKELTGNDVSVRDYVMDFDVSKEFLKKLIDMVTFLLPHYVAEGKNQLVICIGCTGGKHRSVTLANELYQTLVKLGHFVNLSHHDIHN